MPAGDYLVGLGIFALMLAGALAGAWLLLRRGLPQLTGAPAGVAFGVLATLGLLAVHLGPMALGVLTRGTVLAATAVWLAAAALVPAVRGKAAPPLEPGEEEQGEDGRFPRALAWLGVGLVTAFAVAYGIDRAVVASSSIDMLNFHMPGVFRWIQTGSLWQIDVFLSDVAPGHYPNNGDVILLATVLPWSNDFLAHYAMYPFYGLTGLATFALARELRAAPSAALLAACLVLAIPAVAIPALIDGIVDAVMLFAFAAGALFLVRHHRTAATSELVIAGLALGVAFGTKWYGVSSVAIVVAVWAVAALLARRGVRVVLRQGALLAGLVALAGGVWMLRNWIESGNPVFPVKVELAGATIFDAPHDIIRELAGFTILDYANDPGVWSEFILPQFREALAGPAILLGLGFVVGVGALLARRRLRLARPGPLAACAAAGALIALAYSITPYSAAGPEGKPLLVAADSRYLVPALVLAAAVGAAVAGALRWGLAAFAIAGLIAVVDGLNWSARGTLVGGHLGVAEWLAAIAATLVVLVGVPWAWARLDPPRRPVAVGVAVVGVIVAAVVVGDIAQERYNVHRYSGNDPVIDWVLDEADSGQRIGLAGAWDDESIAPVLPAFGPRVENEVEYVGRNDKDMLRRYERRRDFVSALDEGAYDYVIVGLGRPLVTDIPEDRWARDAGFTPVAQSDRLMLLRAPA